MGALPRYQPMAGKPGEPPHGRGNPRGLPQASGTVWDLHLFVYADGAGAVSGFLCTLAITETSFPKAWL